jgi:hypothetical protein
MPTEAGYTDELTQYCPEYFLRRPSGDRRCSLPFVSFALQKLPPRARQAIQPGNGAWPQPTFSKSFIAMLSLKTFDENFNATLLTIDCLNSCGQHRRMKSENAVK